MSACGPLAAVAVLLLGCGLQPGGGADGTVHFEQHSPSDGAGTDDTRVQSPGEVICTGGVGCVGEPCSGPEDCASNWCVDHLGAQVCTIPCDGTCPPGWVCGPVAVGTPAEVKVCLSLHPTLCRPCNSSFDCLRVDGMLGQCLSYGAAGSFCGAPCSADKPCPGGYECKSATTIEGLVMDQCLPVSGECKCTQASVDLGLWTACEVTSEAGTCPGKRSCESTGLSSCLGPVPQFESCNKVDDDCDGKTDEEGCAEDLCGKPDACSAGEVEEEVEPCAPCSTRKRTRVCSDTCQWGAWGEWGACDESGNICLPGEIETEDGFCGQCGSDERKRTCTAECVWGEWEEWSACAGEGVCPPGVTDTATEGCGNCGSHTRSRVCADNCQWGNWGAWGACTGAGPCVPGQVDGGGCDECAQKVCQANCQWGACGLKPGANCLWEQGKNWKCCAPGKWHFCLPPVYGCVWSGQCNPCSNCGC